MSAITLDLMRDKLLSMEQVETALQQIEPLGTIHLSSDQTVRFRLEPDWAHGIDALSNTEPVGAFVTVDSVERQLTKEAALQAGANFGLPGAYAKKVPASYVEGLLNYHYGKGMGANEYNMLTSRDYAAAFVRPTLVPFSNMDLLEAVVGGIRERHGQDTPVFADYKFVNTLQATNIRLIVPIVQRQMLDTDMEDVPTGEEDVWFAGLHLSNSLIGKSMTALDGYLFRWWCTNGATTQIASVEPWSRKSQGQHDTVYQWAQESVDAVLGGLESRFDEVHALTALDVSGNTGEVLREVFQDFDVPVSQRHTIQDSLLRQEAPATMYHVMNAITQTANDSELPDARRDKLMRIGGMLPTETFDTMKAKIWREGHSADPSARNPYEIRQVA